ncbi:MAG: hypothetical protein RIR12_1669 [Bacteroidota bacterium]|jgi:enolase
MSENKNALKDTIKLAGKVDLKKTEKSLEKTELAVKRIHSTQSENVRVSLDLPAALYIKAKTKVAIQRQTLREYLISLVEKDNNGEN